MAVEDDSYPRLDTIGQLLHIISTYPKLARDASAALIDLGDAIREVASAGEIKEMIAGTLSKDSAVRNAALQALQVSWLIQVIGPQLTSCSLWTLRTWITRKNCTLPLMIPTSRMPTLQLISGRAMDSTFQKHTFLPCSNI